MKKNEILIISVMICMLSFVASSAFAAEPIPNKSGFSGFIMLGVNYADMKSNTVAGNSFSDVGNSVIGSVNDEPGSESDVGAAFNFELKYTFADTGTQLFLGNELEDLLRYDLTSQAGVRQKLGKLGTGTIGFIFSAFPTEVWEDPFLTNQARVETDRSSTGVRLVWDDIMGTSFQTQYTFRKIDIDTERSGNPSGYSAADQALLERDGKKHQLELSYLIKGGSRESGTHVFYPSIQYTIDDRDGDAISEDGFNLRVTYGFNAPKYAFTLNGAVGTYESDGINPVFNKTQESDRYGVAAIGFWKNPFAVNLFTEKWSLFMSVAYGKEDSNVSFYDAEVFTSNFGIMLHF